MSDPWDAEDSLDSTTGVLHRIVDLNEKIRHFWSSASGWAPIEAAKLLTRSRLDWQVSLSKTLSLWTSKPPEDQLEGHLILAWANLGALVEGTLKLYLSVWLEDYRQDAARRIELGVSEDPDSLRLDGLRRFVNEVIFKGEWSWNDWVLHIQQRRNAIHAYRHRDLGSLEEFTNDVRQYLAFLGEIDSMLPYP